MEAIQGEKYYTTNEVADLLGCDAGYIRKLKSVHSHDLEGLWVKEGQSVLWSETGLDKLSGWVKTSEALALRENALSQSDREIETHRTEIKTHSVSNILDRYEDLPAFLGGAISNRLINQGVLAQTDAQVVQNLTYALANSKADLASTVADVLSSLED